MPPHRLSRLSPYVTVPNLRHGAKFLLLATILALAGCASNAKNNTAHSPLIHAERDYFLSQTQSDPLGAYLATRDYPSSHAPAGTRTLATTALGFLGIKYRYGGEAPNTGFDCSGLVAYVAEKSLGLKLPRRSAEIAREGQSVRLNELRKGDLVFFNTRGHRYSHVGIYVGNRKFVHAPRTGSVVRVEDMDASYWKKRYNGARRLATNSAPDALASR
ncbi:peptidoglycan endopeptidase [Parapusillimonas sp. SGNA-6]|nr:peptidoglycan endopeptidase [Parapusillimonas sp. SGNA-6]